MSKTTRVKFLAALVVTLLAVPVLAADTTLEFAGDVIGKPLDASDAQAILRRLSGQTHRVLTCVAVAFEERLESVISVSDVRFAVLDEAEIRHYVQFQVA